MLTIAQDCLNSCAGCEIALLNMGEELLAVLPQVEFVHMPILMDHKYFGPLGQGKQLRIPRARVGLVSGGVRNSEHLEVLLAMRQNVDILVALGTCAACGGLPGLADMNPAGVQAVADFAHAEAPSLCAGGEAMPDPQNEDIPEFLPLCSPLSRHVRVDLTLPGCPPHPDWIAEALHALLENRPALLPCRSVCSLCPATRYGTAANPASDPAPNLAPNPAPDLAPNRAPDLAPNRARPLRPLKRMLEQPSYDPQKPLKDMQCLLEQGFMCLGPVTQAGCGGREGAPKCIAARVPCRGCQGPAAHSSLPFVDYVAACTAAGWDAASMPDKPGYLSRFEQPHAILAALRQILAKETC